MSGFDYSKWDNIELSDDESDLHPNIDKDSWFRLKHRTRVEREAKEAEEKAGLEMANEKDGKRISEIVSKLSGKGFNPEEDDRDALEGELEELQAAVKQREERLEYMEKHKKLNVDNICYVAEERTVIVGDKDKDEESKDTFKKDPRAKEVRDKPEPEGKTVRSYAEFTEQHEAMLEEYSEIRSLEDTKNYLHKHGDILLHEHGQSYMLLSCLEDEMNGLHDRMKHVARQCQILTNISELAVSMQRHPRDVVLAFFSRIENPQFKAGFEQAVSDFIVKIQKRAVEKRKEMDEAEAKWRKENPDEATETQEVVLDKEERMGPGGLDPVEVFESLPAAMQEAFESRVIEKLHKAIADMDPADAQYHMKRCVDSGLWNPGPSDDNDENA